MRSDLCLKCLPRGGEPAPCLSAKRKKKKKEVVQVGSSAKLGSDKNRIDSLRHCKLI